MRSKVFLSCGQRKEERRVADKIRQMLNRRGFEVYVAIDAQEISEVNTEIIRHLKDSDYYLFVNFCRDKLPNGKYRGSLFSHQEFAIAFALGFNKIIVVNQEGFEREGLLGYFRCNTRTFKTYLDCPAVVGKAVEHWQPNYSRRLHVGQVYPSRKIHYTNANTGIDLRGDMWYLQIQNRRPDIAALEVTGRLLSYRRAGSRTKVYEPKFRSPLKAAGKDAFSHTIFPQSYEAFDLFCVGKSIYNSSEQHVYLNSSLDLTPTPALEITNGRWELTYEFYAIDFPVLTVLIELNWPEKLRSSAKVLSQEFTR